MRRVTPWVAFALLLVFLLVGCAKKTASVRGKLTDGPSALTAGERDRVTVTFCPYPPSAEVESPSCTAKVNQAEGTYEVQVPPGKYRISVLAFVGMTDKFQGAFSPTASQILRDVTGDQTIDLDLSKPDGQP
jgi:hypothetical protein